MKHYFYYSRAFFLAMLFCLSTWSVNCLADSPFSVFIPQPTHCVDLGFSLLYLKPGDEYIYMSALYDEAGDDKLNHFYANTTHKLSFRVYSTYQSQQSRLISELSWFHYHSGFNTRDTVSDTNVTVSSANLSPLFVGDIDAKAYIRFSDDTVDFSVGQPVSLGDLSMRLSAGLRYANLQQRIKENIVSTSGFTGETTLLGKFRGIGPGLILDASYPLTHGFSIAGRFSSHFLVGRKKKNIYNIYSSGSVIRTDFSDKKDLLVKSFAMNARLNYAHPILSSHSTLNFWLGYEMVTYLDAMSYSHNNAYIGRVSNFTLHGPNAGLSVSF